MKSSFCTFFSNERTAAAMTMKESPSTTDASTTEHLTTLQRQNVDKVFERLFGYPWVYDDNNKNQLTQRTTTTTMDSIYAVATDNPTHQLRFDKNNALCILLGPRKAGRFLQITHQHLRKVTVNRKRKQNYSLKSLYFAPTKQNIPSIISGRNTMQTTVSTLQQQQELTSSVSVSKTTEPPAVLSSSNTSGLPSGSSSIVLEKKDDNVDALLEQLSGPSKLTTVAKTSMDWDHFKTTTGLGTSLEEQAESKTSYLKKQEFLQRVDHRTFDLEKVQRERNRLKK